MKGWKKGDDQGLVRYTAPPKERGHGLPPQRATAPGSSCPRPRRWCASAPSRTSAAATSRNARHLPALARAATTCPTLAGEETADGQSCYKLDLKAKDRSVAYDRVRATGCAATAPSSRCAPSTTRSRASKLKWLTVSEVALGWAGARVHAPDHGERAGAGARTRAALPRRSRTTRARRPAVHAERAGARASEGGLPCLALLALPRGRRRASREIEVGLENFYYRTAETPLNRGNVLRLDPSEDLLRGDAAAGRRAVATTCAWWSAATCERALGGRSDTTDWTLRQAYVQYGGASTSPACAWGKQRIAWGSGFAWNPTNRIERAQEPLQLRLEQEGSLAARVDWFPSSWAGVILVAARSETERADLPFAVRAPRRRTAGRCAAASSCKDTDLALVALGRAATQRTLVGLDVGARPWAAVTVHAEAAVYRGAEMAPPRDGRALLPPGHRPAADARRAPHARGRVLLQRRGLRRPRNARPGCRGCAQLGRRASTRGCRRRSARPRPA